MQLSKNFTLEEMLDSQTAVRLSFDEQFSPPDSIKENLKALCENVLEPLRNKLDSPIIISSGYRCERLNKTIGGAKTSQHLYGMAVDFTSVKDAVEFVFQVIKESDLEYDQVIQEFNKWVHVSYNPFGQNRNQCLRAVKVSGVTKYIPD